MLGFALLALLGLFLAGLLGYLQYQSLQKTQQSLRHTWKTWKEPQRFPLWPAAQNAKPQNGFEAYWQLIGRPRDLPVSKSKPYFEIPTQDALRIQALFDPHSGRVLPAPELTAKYGPLLKQWTQIPPYAWIAYPDQYSVDMAMPHLLLVEQLSLLNSSQAVQNCQKGTCQPKQLFQNLALIRAQAAQGLLIPLMNSYRLERMLFSAWGHELTPSALSAQAWQDCLNNLSDFLLNPHPSFALVLQNQMYLSQLLLFEPLPENLGEIKVETGDEKVWAESLPQQLYQTLALRPQIQQSLDLLAPLEAISLAYLQAPVHSPLALEKVQTAMASAQSQDLLKNVLPPVDFALLRFREQEAWRRGFYLHLALQAWHAQHGHYPSKLEELSALLKKPLPQDPFTGQNFRYLPKGRGYSLYSLGPDQKDQGGGSSYHCFAKELKCQHTEVRFHPH